MRRALLRQDDSSQEGAHIAPHAFEHAACDELAANVIRNSGIHRSEAGYQLREVQKGFDAADWKPLKTVGPGVREIRIREAAGAFRVIYVASVGEQVVVLHAFQKKTQGTSQHDIDLATSRLRAWKG